MEFYSRMKDELTHTIGDHECCREAELSALVKTDGVLSISEGRLALMLRESNAGVARKIVSLLRETGRPRLEMAVRKGRALPKGNTYIIRIPDQGDAFDVMKRLGLRSSLGYADGISPKVVEKRCCKRAHLRGAFLGAGYMAEPEKGYHLEIAVPDEAYAQQLAAMLAEFGIWAGIVARRDKWVVYLKDGDDIVELLRVMDATNSLLDLENMRIVRSIRNDVNRLVNAESANLAKSVDASLRQVQDIILIDEVIGIERLPRALRDTCCARLENPEVSLAELGGMMSPSVGKSGVNHRMRRLGAIADSLRRRDRERR
ncbi:MAG: DNA-binding protein WhiA [Clostridia bacterium]|nr:DNA-binding protein WhiA [Clostridia bacterium]